ncbi:hypothetical protein [Paracraurococcus lichenis]|uniref:Copper-binding protein n=1 Tax=Paracraurococcus lichenis TaxID=3064888 RepID=A0ABT9EE72_9PROT|nr:hypothetical protein [Paracraurococcus sp. LOR1-02]MDO9714278.1 hypothetical protein [Paracraurococcus sp. LOR1-02]
MRSNLAPAAAFTILLLAATPLGQGLAQTGQRPEGAVIDEVTEVRATVESVDLTTREVLLRGPEGGLMTVRVRPDVRRLNELKPGDQIVARYADAVAVRMARPEEASMPPSVQAGSATAGADRPPGAVVGGQTSAIVTIQEVDPVRSAVTFIGPAGVPRRVVVQDPAMRDFASGLKPGDRVNVTYSEAVAVSVEPMQR